MFKRILVPLDGSQLSGRALPYATEIAQRFRAEVILLRVVPPTPIPPMGAQTLPEVIEKVEKEASEKDRRNVASARRYLQRNLQQLVAHGIRSSQHVVVGAPAKSIVEFSHGRDVDLVVMTTHGRSELKRALLGSVSDEVIRESGMPVLTIRPQRRYKKQGS